MNIIQQFSNSPENWTKKKKKMALQNFSTSNFFDNLKTEGKIFNIENRSISEEGDKLSKNDEIKQNLKKKYCKKSKGEKNNENKIKQLILPLKVFSEEDFEDFNKDKKINTKSFR